MVNEVVASLMEAKGAIAYNMTNNYMFRYILQKNMKVLKGLICALLHLKPEEVKTVEIKNPIDLAADVSGKEFILDIKILLNNNQILNLEMQVKNEHNWEERSLVYLCRSFDQLYRGQKYEDALPAIHIGFTDFTMCPEAPEFYATHMLLNIKNNRIYSDKFVLSVVDLTKIDLATEEDKEYKIDYWARIFKAKTWEELKTYMKKDECIDETIYSLYQANADEIIRERCLAREDAERRERTYKKFYQQYKEDYERAMVENAALQADKDALQADKDALQADKDALQADKDALQADKDALQVNNVVLQKNIDDMKALIKELQDKLAKKE